MTAPSKSCSTPPASARPRVEAVVARYAEKAEVDAAVVRTFAEISSPLNKAVFSARSATKAFAHVKID